MTKNVRHPKDKWILICFLSFFGVIFILDGIFVYLAVSTQTGVVTERPYEKGLAYNETLQQAKNQPKLKEEVLYEAPFLRWEISDENGKSLEKATVTARLIRPVQEGHDFDITLTYKGDGLYEAPINLPLKGLWVAQLESKWTENKQSKTYKTTYRFITK